MAKAENVKNFALTPANQATVTPPMQLKLKFQDQVELQLIKKVMLRTVKGKNKYLILLTLQLKYDDNILLKIISILFSLIQKVVNS